jgi:hypothetical protein
MAIPETDLLRVGRWCSTRVPADAQHELRVECDIEDRHVTIIEARPAWNGRGDWIRAPIARLRYTATTGQWSLYWCDQNDKFHEYTRRRPTKTVQSLLDYLDSFEDPIFWG